MAHTAESLQQAFHYLFKDEIPALKRLAQSLPDNPVVVNLGAGAGTSGLAFMESRPDLRLITIDIEDGDSPLGSLLSEKNMLKDAGLWNDRVTHKKGDSVKVGNYWLMAGTVHGLSSYDKVDMVFIDADHSYEGCKGDILAWLPNIKAGGILAIHDYKKSKLTYDDNSPHPQDWPGVDQAVDELLLGKYELVLKVDSLIAFRV